MSGHWFWNFLFGLFGFLLYFLLAIEKNEPMELMIQSVAVFIILFIVMYIIRFLWAIVISTPEKPTKEIEIESKKELVTLTKQLEKEDVEKVVAFIRTQIQKERKG